MGNLSQSTLTNNLPESWLVQKVRKKLDTTLDTTHFYNHN